MSDRVVNYYEFQGKAPDWEKLKQAFKRNVSKYNVPFFEADSGTEGEFAGFCQASNLAAHRMTIIEYDGKFCEADRFLFLCLKDDSGSCFAEGGQSLVDLTGACPGGGAFGSCGRGAKQVGKLIVEAKGVQRVKTLGLLSCRYPSVPRVFLASVTVGEALSKAGASGCEIIPTNTPNCCQLRITVETTGAAQIGHARMGKRCPACGAAKMFIGNSERFFHHGDLKPTDFQICRSYAADNVGQFQILNGFPIVSQRIFNLLLALKVKGLERYSTDPPIRHAVVQCRDTSEPPLRGSDY